MNQIAFVKANPTVCNTLVIDTIDWAETLAIESVCAQHGKKGIEDFGYGNGYTYVREEFWTIPKQTSRISGYLESMWC